MVWASGSMSMMVPFGGVPMMGRRISFWTIVTDWISAARTSSDVRPPIRPSLSGAVPAKATISAVLRRLTIHSSRRFAMVGRKNKASVNRIKPAPIVNSRAVKPSLGLNSAEAVDVAASRLSLGTFRVTCVARSFSKKLPVTNEAKHQTRHTPL